MNRKWMEPYSGSPNAPNIVSSAVRDAKKVEQKKAAVKLIFHQFDGGLLQKLR
ncbi:hypothetical protein P0082_04680 [Candidatus Haliotispira prima]|uniref:Uncharacterized protein n=1 Tax=Candidatus Haliotispira prima TaxID=3034016 RepID=A0ABY8MJF9_9SPIO|nr:hypothetical protein P0082_04680 [Candidatus Haliotispira prima]